MQALQQAAKAAQVAVWNADQVHNIGDVPNDPPSPYNIVGVGSGAGATYRFSGEHGSKSYRLAVQCVGQNADEVTFAVDKADAAFLDQQLQVTGYDTTPCKAEASSPIIRDPDGGVLLTCTVLYTFSAFPTA